MEKLLTTKEAAEILQCHPQTIYRNKELPRVVIPGVGIRFKEKKINEYIEQRTIIPLLNHTQLIHNKSFRLTNTPENGIIIPKIGGICELTKSKSKTRYNFGYGAIYQRKTKKGKIRWYLDYRDENGKRIQEVARNAIEKEEALLLLRNKVARVFKNECGIKEKKKVHLKDFTDIYLENYAKMKKRSWESDQKYIRAQLIPFFGEMKLSEITPLHVNQFMKKRQKDGVKNSTINRELTVLKKMLNLAIEWGYEIEFNPVKRGNFFSEEEFKRNRVLTDEEEERLYQEAASHLRPILTCALSTAMRLSEIIGLKWENVDLDQKQITVNAQSSKSGKQRVIPINETLLCELERLKKMNGGISEYVFLYRDPKTGKLRQIETVRRAFVMACKRAGIENFTFHDIRHTVGSRLIMKGVDPVSVKNILGHSNLKTTEIYLHSSLKQMVEAVAKLDEKHSEKAENLNNLLHICDMKSKEEKTKFTNAFISAN